MYNEDDNFVDLDIPTLIESARRSSLKISRLLVCLSKIIQSPLAVLSNSLRGEPENFQIFFNYGNEKKLSQFFLKRGK